MTTEQLDQVRWLSQLEQNAAAAVGSGPHGYQTIGDAGPAGFPNGLAEHVIWMVVNGTGQISTQQQVINLRPGSAIWLRPHTPFSLDLGSSPVTLYRLRLSAMPEVDGVLPPILCLTDCWDLRHSFDALVAELDTDLPLQAKRLHGLLLVLFTSLFRLAERGAGVAFDIAQRRAIQEYLDSHIRERVTVADLAAVAALSPTRFTQRFRQTFSIPPRTWIMHRRVHHAALLMDTSTRTITQVARALGYRDLYFFSRQFKQVMGMSPRAYRKRGSQAPDRP